MNVLSKWQVFKIEDQGWYKSVLLMPVTADTEENKQFWEATPSGDMRINISNPAASAQFKEGQQIVVEFHIPEE